MAREVQLLTKVKKAYEEARAAEAEELHNAIVGVIHEHNPSLENAVFVLDLIRFSLMEAKYKEIMGFVKLTDKPPLKVTEKKE